MEDFKSCMLEFFKQQEKQQREGLKYCNIALNAGRKDFCSYWNVLQKKKRLRQFYYILARLGN